MKHLPRLALLGLTLALGGVAASHADARPPQINFETLDINSDGQITQSEFAEHRAARFASVDTNGDGLLSRAELQAQGEARAQKRATRMLERLDSNDDGQLSQEEMAQARRGGGPERLFKRVDADGDGVITQAEFETLREMAERRRKP